MTVWFLVALAFWTSQVSVETVSGPYASFEECRRAGSGNEKPLGSMRPLDRTVQICVAHNAPQAGP